jgi:ubiquinone/menaquinone biosynthesis C-methylase UbiE
LWVAAQTGARPVGVDISRVGLESAARKSVAMGLADRCRWVEGSFEATRPDQGSLDAAMSVDALLFTPDKGAAAREFARIIQPSGRLVFTTFDYTGQPVGRPPQVEDHCPLLEGAGFEVLAYEETEDWHHRLKATGDALLAAVGELAAESGEDRAVVEAEVREMNATLDVIKRRVFVVAERR